MIIIIIKFKNGDKNFNRDQFNTSSITLND